MKARERERTYRLRAHLSCYLVLAFEHIYPIVWLFSKREQAAPYFPSAKVYQLPSTPSRLLLLLSSASLLVHENGWLVLHANALEKGITHYFALTKSSPTRKATEKKKEQKSRVRNKRWEGDEETEYQFDANLYGNRAKRKCDVRPQQHNLYMASIHSI